MMQRAVILGLLAGLAFPVAAGDRPVVVAPRVFVPPVAVLGVVDGGIAPARGAPVTFAAGGLAALPATASSAGTATAVQAIRAVVVFCESLAAPDYAIDCLSERLGAVAAAMPRSGDYAEARTAIAAASRALGDLARANADPERPAARGRSGGVTTGRPLVPVRPDRRAAANARASAILDETETLLLRSAGSDARQTHYASIAAALGSGKVLLRSA